MQLRTRTRSLAAGTAVLGLALTLVACSGGDGGTGAGSSSGERLANGDLSTVNIGIHSGWDEGIAVSELFRVMLEEEGYTVKSDEADAGLVYASLASGDFDVNFDMWLPVTHGDFLAQYGDDLEQLGAWYDNAQLTIAVNEDAPITSLDELAANADLFGNRLVGIEAGGGLVRITKDEAIPAYGLEGMDFITSSTPAMLAELRGATEAGENIAVTLWRPHWAYDAFPVRDLEDPQGAMGTTEEITTIARSGFSEDYPALTQLIQAFTLTDNQLFSLENLMFNKGKGEDPTGAAREWLANNPTFVDDLKASAGV